MKRIVCQMKLSFGDFLSQLYWLSSPIWRFCSKRQQRQRHKKSNTKIRDGGRMIMSCLIYSLRRVWGLLWSMNSRSASLYKVVIVRFLSPRLTLFNLVLQQLTRIFNGSLLLSCQWIEATSDMKIWFSNRKSAVTLYKTDVSLISTTLLSQKITILLRLTNFATN